MSTARDGRRGALSFPEGFIFGAATAAYQVEGAASENGRGLSVWDTFSHTPGKVLHGDTGDVACDTYHRYREDVALMASLSLPSYRFSISWPRVQPGGRGPVNQKGLDYYRSLVDELNGHGISPVATLYHWDLPQELQDDGGWTVRTTAERFAQYTAIVAAALGDGVTRWLTLNEPQVVVNNGYRLGTHAPGLHDIHAAAAATHHLLLGHGMALGVLRDLLPDGVPVGITLDMHPVQLTSGVPDENLLAARRMADAELHGVFLEPVLHGRYPTEAREDFLAPPTIVADGDLDEIARPLDFLGVNYYSAIYLKTGDPDDLRRNEQPSRWPLPGVVEYRPEWLAQTSMGWTVDPEAFADLLVDLSRRAPGLPIYVTENGCAAEDYVDPDGVVNDVERIRYLHDHLAAVAKAIEAGANVAGYFAWSLLDNFEWSWGYQKRFGIVYVDFETQRRIPKQSSRFYADVIRSRAIPPLQDG